MSRALADVRMLFPEVDQLLKLGNQPHALRQSACARAAVVLSHAHLERYFEKVLREAVAALNDKAPARTRWAEPIHKSILVHGLLGHARAVRKFASDPGSTQCRDSAATLATKAADLCNFCRKVPLDYAALKLKSKYPKIKTIKATLARLGLPQAVKDLEAKDGVTYGMQLASLNRMRGKVAHGDTFPPAIADVRVAVANSRKFMKSLDQLIGAHITALTGVAPW